MSFFGKLFNSDKKDTTYRGETPYQSLLDAPGGKDYYKILMDRMAGRGVGYGDNYVSNANPQVANLRNTFESYNIPELTSELSLTGRRRGSGGFDQLSRAYKDESLNENDIVSRLAQRQSEASREDVNNAITGVGEFNQREANTKNNYANFEYSDNNRQVNEANQRRANQAAGLQNAVYAGSDMASAYFGGGQGPGNRQAPQVGQTYGYAAANPNVGFGQSGNSLNQRRALRAKIGQQGGY